MLRTMPVSAAMNAMMILRGHRADYDAWAAAGSTGWGWEDVEPAFARSAQGAFPLGSLPEQHVLADQRVGGDVAAAKVFHESPLHQIPVAGRIQWSKRGRHARVTQHLRLAPVLHS